MIHTTVDTRRTGMPSSDARSLFSAEARTAIPMSVKRKKAPRPTTIPSTTTSVTTWSPVKRTMPTLKWKRWKGVGKLVGGIDCPLTHFGT